MSAPHERSRMRPHECELCDCVQYEWNLRSNVYATDPPSTCMCGHLVSRHRFRPARAGGGSW